VKKVGILLNSSKTFPAASVRCNEMKITTEKSPKRRLPVAAGPGQGRKSNSRDNGEVKKRVKGYEGGGDCALPSDLSSPISSGMFGIQTNSEEHLFGSGAVIWN